MHSEVQKILERVKQTADFGYVDFSDINATNVLGDNALHCVIRWRDFDSAKLLVAHGIDVNQKGEDGYTPLHVACAYGQKEIAKVLLEAGANPFTRTAGDLPFTTARLRGHDELCDLIAGYTAKMKTDDVYLQSHRKHLEALARLTSYRSKLTRIVVKAAKRKILFQS